MDSDEPKFAPRLENIETQWSLLQRAHHGTIVSGNDARKSLVLRYASAIRSYVKAMTGNEADTDELSQDVVVRLMKGDFAGADPDRGRFRDLLKVAVRNMVRNHWDKSNRRKGVNYDLALAADQAEGASEDPWLDGWRKNIIDIAMGRLEAYQHQHDGNISHSVLKIRMDFPDLDSTGLAEKISTEQGREINAATYRQQLRRARIRFAQYLVEEIANGLDTSDPQRVQEELISVGLFEHIKDVLPDEWQENTA